MAAAWLFGAAGVILAGIGVFFIFFRPWLLAEDLRFLGRHSSEIDCQAVCRPRSGLFELLGELNTRMVTPAAPRCARADRGQ